MNEKIKAILSEILETQDIDENLSQKSYPGWDSLHHLNLVIALEEKFRVTLEPEDIAIMNNYRNIHSVLTQKGAEL